MKQIKNSIPQASNWILAVFNKLVNFLNFLRHSEHSEESFEFVGWGFYPNGPTCHSEHSEESFKFVGWSFYPNGPTCHSEHSEESFEMLRLKPQHDGSWIAALASLVRNDKKKAFGFTHTAHCSPLTVHSSGFTLAEVLLTLGIIGVVAAMTIPAIKSKADEVATISALKKTYSTLSQAYTSAVQENGTPENWDIVAMNSPVGAKNVLDKLAPFLRLQKNCGVNTGCFPDLTYKRLMGTGWANLETDSSNLGINRAILSDGTLIYIQARNKDCLEGAGVGTSLAEQNVCAFIGVDTNGFNKPNRWGYDLFSFKLTKYGIIPRGSAADMSSPFSGNCSNKNTHIGWSCAAWVIYNENMDYLKCSDLSWDGKHKCGD